MSDRRCETCRHWDHNEWKRSRLASDSGLDMPNHRVCRSTMWSVGWPPVSKFAPLAVLGNVYGEEGSVLVTAPEFSCALWEAKP